MVTGVIYRYPGILVKTATTLDILSGDVPIFNRCRLERARSERAGRALPPLGVRFELLEEALQIAKQMWSPDNGPITASTITSKKPCAARSRCHARTRRFWSRARREENPADGRAVRGCLQSIRAAGNGERQTGDSEAALRCSRRDYGSIEKTTLAPWTYSGENDCERRHRAMQGARCHGVQHAIFNIPNVHEIRRSRCSARDHPGRRGSLTAAAPVRCATAAAARACAAAALDSERFQYDDGNLPVGLGLVQSVRPIDLHHHRPQRCSLAASAVCARAVNFSALTCTLTSGLA